MKRGWPSVVCRKSQGTPHPQEFLGRLVGPSPPDPAVFSHKSSTRCSTDAQIHVDKPAVPTNTVPMNKFVAVLALFAIFACTPAFADFVSGGNPCANPEATINFISGITAGTSLVQIIPAVTGQQIFICSLTAQGISGTSETFGMSYGSGANCAVGTQNFFEPINTPANIFMPFSGPIARIPAGNALCYLNTGTTPVEKYWISYVQK